MTDAQIAENHKQLMAYLEAQMIELEAGIAANWKNPSIALDLAEQHGKLAALTFFGQLVLAQIEAGHVADKGDQSIP